jgi:hypothetical protein
MVYELVDVLSAFLVDSVVSLAEYKGIWINRARLWPFPRIVIIIINN